MTEFKFSCPACGQRIQVTDAYSGRQISCPACQEPMLVPAAPGQPEVIPANAVPPMPPTQPPATVPGRRHAAPPGTRSGLKWVVLGSAAGLIAVGAITVVLVSGPASPATSSTAGMAGTPSPARKDGSASRSPSPQNLSASDIAQKATAQYASLTSCCAKGTAVSLMEMGKVNAKNEPVRVECEFSVRLGRPALYRVEWESKGGPGAMSGAVWSAGEGHFLSLANAKPTRMQNRQIALASALGVSGGAAGTLPAIFFHDQASPLNLLKHAQMGKDETVAGEDCYVLSANAGGTKTILWLTKSDFRLKQRQTVFEGKAPGPQMSEADMERALKRMGNLSPQQAAQAKAAMKSMKPLLSQMKGTITETYHNIEVNLPVNKEDFNRDLPAGTALSKSSF